MRYKLIIPAQRKDLNNLQHLRVLSFLIVTISLQLQVKKIIVSALKELLMKLLLIIKSKMDMELCCIIINTITKGNGGMDKNTGKVFLLVKMVHTTLGNGKTIWHVGKVYTDQYVIILIIMVNGRKDKKMGKEFKFIKMDLPIKEILFEDKKMGKVSFFIQMVLNIKANFQTTLFKVTVFSKEKITFTKENGKMEKCMVQVEVNGRIRRG